VRVVVVAVVETLGAGGGREIVCEASVGMFEYEMVGDGE